MEFGGQPGILCVTRSVEIWFEHMTEITPLCLTLRVFWACPTGERAEIDPDLTEGIIHYIPSGLGTLTDPLAGYPTSAIWSNLFHDFLIYCRYLLPFKVRKIVLQFASPPLYIQFQRYKPIHWLSSRDYVKLLKNVWMIYYMICYMYIIHYMYITYVLSKAKKPIKHFSHQHRLSMLSHGKICWLIKSQTSD